MSAAPAMTAFQPGCVLCEGSGGRLVFEAPRWRVIHAEEAGFPAFYRLVWKAHVAEFSDLPRADQILCLDVLTQIERALRTQLAPTKINLAALGNAVPHLHWHVIARFDWDSHFPGAVWAGAVRATTPAQLARVQAALPALEQALQASLQALAS